MAGEECDSTCSGQPDIQTLPFEVSRREKEHRWMIRRYRSDGSTADIYCQLQNPDLLCSGFLVHGEEVQGVAGGTFQVKGNEHTEAIEILC